MSQLCLLQSRSPCHRWLLTEPLLLRRPLPPPVRLCWPAPVRGCDCVLTGGGLARVPLPDAPLRPGRFAYSSPCLRAGGGAASGNATLAPPSMGMRHHHHHVVVVVVVVVVIILVVPVVPIVPVVLLLLLLLVVVGVGVGVGVGIKAQGCSDY